MEKKPNVSKHLLDKAAFIFLRHPGQFYSRADIQKLLETSKPTACRILVELSEIINLQEKVEGQTSYYSVNEEDAKHVYQTLEFVNAINDKERLALNFLVNMQVISKIFGQSIVELGKKLDNAGLISYQPVAIQEARRPAQKIEKENANLIDTLFTALETKTKIEIDYKAAFSDKVKKHELYPVGLYLRDSNLYLYAYSPIYKNATSYAYSRIINACILYDEHYTIPEEISINHIINDPFGVAMSKPQKAKIHIYNKQVDFEKEKKWPQGTNLIENPDGSLTIETKIADPFAFRCWALSLGKDCFVEEPKDIAEWIYREHKQACKLYEEKHKK